MYRPPRINPMGCARVRFSTCLGSGTPPDIVRVNAALNAIMEPPEDVAQFRRPGAFAGQSSAYGSQRGYIAHLAKMRDFITPAEIPPGF